MYIMPTSFCWNLFLIPRPLFRAWTRMSDCLQDMATQMSHKYLKLLCNVILSPNPPLSCHPTLLSIKSPNPQALSLLSPQ